MKTILRNFLNTLSRFRLATFLNVVGLTVAFAAFLVIMMQVRYERSFDRCHPNADRIYRVEINWKSEGSSSILSRPFIDAVIQSSPLIEAGTLLNPYNGEPYFSILRGQDKIGFKEPFVTCYPDITRMFHFEMKEGVPNCLEEADKVLIPESMARKLFGNEPALNQRLNQEEAIWCKQDSGFLVVGGVYKDFPGNTQLDNVVYTRMADNYTMTDWKSSNYFGFVLLSPGASPEEVAANFNRTFDYTKIGRNAEEVYVSLRPLTDIYYLNESQDGRLIKSGNEETTRLLLFAAFLILIVAAINFTNFSTALTPLRIKSINTQKVLGSSTMALRLSLLVEAIGIALLSYLLSLSLIYLLNNAEMLSFVKADLSLTHNLGLLTGVCGLSLLVGGIAGLYPAYYITSFPPALVLKGSFGLSPTGRNLRTILMGFQFVVSIILIVGAFFIYIQNRYMRTFSLGFDKDQIAVVEISGEMARYAKEAYVNKLKENPGIEDVAFANERLGAQDGYMTWSGMYKNQSMGMTVLPVSWNFTQVMGIKHTVGRTLTEADGKGDNLVFIPYESMRKQYNMSPGESIEIPWMKDTQCEIACFAEDVQFTSLRQECKNVVLVTNYWSPLPVSYIRIKSGGDIREVVHHIRETVASIDPSYPVDVEFYDTIFNDLYKQEENLSTMVLLFSLLAIILSLVGVFGLVVFEAQYRRKEIGVRRVHGSTILEILSMLSKRYVIIVLSCFVLGSPLAYYLIQQWLQGFVYKTPLYWWVFAASFLIVLLITVTTVVFQSWRAATANPVESLRNE